MLNQALITSLTAVVMGKLQGKTRKQKEGIVCDFLKKIAIQGMQLPEYRSDRYFRDYPDLLLRATFVKWIFICSWTLNSVFGKVTR